MNWLSEPMPAPTVSLSFLASQFGAHAAQTFARELETLGLRSQDAGLLRMLAARGGMTQIEMSETFGVLPSRMVVLVDRLEAAGLVSRARDEQDRRRIRVNLSAAGHEMAERIAALTAAMDEELFRLLGETERTILRDMLTRLAEAQNLRAGVHPAYREI